MGVRWTVDPRFVEEWVQRTCAAQGVPVKVTDARVIEQVAVLVGQMRQTGSRRVGSKRARPRVPGPTTT